MVSLIALALTVLLVGTASAQESQFVPAFPLRGLEPTSPQIINSVSDLSLGPGSYAEDNLVRAYTGEEGARRFGAREGCYQKDAVGTEFILSGNYRGAMGAQSLCYDGHPGVDFKVDGADVLVAADGVVVELKGDAPDDPDLSCACFGNYVKIDHGNGFISIYGHLRKNSLIKGATGSVLQVNDQVTRGEQIALSGNSGVSSGPHLHFELRQRKATGGLVVVDPYSLWAPQHNFIWVSP